MLYITGDIHGTWDEREQFIRSLSKEDILIVLGDWGWCWTSEHLKRYLKNNPECIQLWIDGNHEGYNVIDTFPIVKIYGGRAHKIADNIYHLIRGEMYEIEGKKFLVFGGALSIDKHWRTPYVSWWPQEQPTMSDYSNAIENLKKNNWKFDYLLTHTADTELVQTVLGTTDTVNDSTERMISQLKYEIKENEGSFKKHFFGHLHQFWKGVSDDYEWYCLYTQIYDLAFDKVTFYDDKVYV
jgi:predicted phosphodiesterase